MRTLPVLLLAVGIVASVSSCATTPFSEGCDSAITSGPASSLVSATGAFGAEPTINFPTPIITKNLERSELITGTGPELASGDVVLLQFTMLNGSTEEIGAQSDYSGSGALITLGESEIPAVSKGLQCVTVGSRVALASSAANAGADPTQVKDSIVLVIDVIKAFPGKAYGVPQIPQAGMPSIVTAPDGTPGATVPKKDPPATLTANVLQQADGAKLKSGEHAVVKYTGFLWSDGSVFHSTWPKGQADVVTLTAPAAGTLTAPTQVTPGFVDALVGQQIGSQVLIVVPPAQGYGDAIVSGVPSGSTLIYVVDILGIVG